MHRFAPLLVGLLATTGLMAADEKPYAANWWQEYGPDPVTIRLFHFGKPQALPWEHLVGEGIAQREEEQDDEDLLEDIMDLDADAAAVAEASDEALVEDVSGRAEAERLAAEVPEPAVPSDRVYDYSDARAVVELGKGVEVVREGRFGSALRFDGTGPGLVLMPGGERLGDASVAECWIRVEALPEQPACIISAGNDQSRLLLLPDGRLEIWRKQPYGTLREEMFQRQGSMAELEAYKNSDMTIRSDRQIPVGEWVHVAYGRGQTAVVNAYVGYLWINGVEVAQHQACKYNHYNFMTGGGGPAIVVGNSVAGEHPFVGKLDEFRFSRGQIDWGRPARHFNHYVEQDWFDPDASRTLRFGKPYFLQDATIGHLGLEDGLAFAFHTGGASAAHWERAVDELEPLQVAGVRGNGLVIDPRVARLHVPVDGLALDAGAIDFWVKPLNWDDNRSMPVVSLIAQVAGSKEADHQAMRVLKLVPRRPHHNEPGEPSFHPGVWTHYTLNWWRQQGQFGTNLHYQVFENHRHRWRGSRVRRVGERDLGVDPARLVLTAVEFGTPPGRIGNDGREGRIAIDEVVLYNDPLQPADAVQAHLRAQQELKPISRIDPSIGYRRSLGEINLAVRSQLERGIEPAAARIDAVDADGGSIVEGLEIPFEMSYRRKGNDKVEDGLVARATLASGYRLPPGPVTLEITLVDDAGGELVSEVHDGWQYQPEPWYRNEIGVSKRPQAPWTPIRFEGDRLETLVTSYTLGEDGLPTAIEAKGENILARPIRLLEDGKPMRAGGVERGEQHPGEVEWRTTFSGETCRVRMHCRAEFDGMIRYELTVEPTAETVGRLTFEIPVAAEHATYRGYQLASHGHFSVQQVDDDAPFTSRGVRYHSATKRARQRKEAVPSQADWRGYAFFTQLDLNDLDRGLYWFADNARGWRQSDVHPSQEVVTEDGARVIRCHLVAEPGPYQAGTPIVFGLLPHPTRPLPDDYRYFDEAPAPDDPLTNDLTGSVFLALPRSPKGGEGMMEVFPRDRDWDVAEKAGENLRSMASGYRTMYLSIGYMKCRAGAYDHQDWRNMNGSRMSLTPSFVDYILWEIDEWVSRDIYDAFYLDDSYAFPIRGQRAVEAGQAVRLPDGSIQPGIHLFAHREMMKRWRQVMIDHGKRPMIMAHHTGTWMFPGFVFCESVLDGEGAPTITHRGKERTFIDAFWGDKRSRFKVVQNPYLWGVTKFYMPSIWGFGPLAKGESPHRKWAWRMARGAQGMLAHLENHSTYYDEGGEVYDRYWESLKRWGALDPGVAFVPFHHVGDEVQLADDAGDTWVSYYRKDGAILLIVTNLEREDRDLELTLDLAALGLDDGATLRPWDAAFLPPDSTDPYEMAKSDLLKADIDDTVAELGMEDDGIDVLGELQKEEKAAERAQREKVGPPVLDGERLTVPLRKHDFRVIALE